MRSAVAGHHHHNDQQHLYTQQRNQSRTKYTWLVIIFQRIELNKMEWSLKIIVIIPLRLPRHYCIETPMRHVAMAYRNVVVPLQMKQIIIISREPERHLMSYNYPPKQKGRCVRSVYLVYMAPPDSAKQTTEHLHSAQAKNNKYIYRHRAWLGLTTPKKCVE